MKARIDLQKIPEGSQQQTCGNQEHQREGNFSAYQRLPERRGAPGGGPASVAQIRCDGLCLRRLQGRYEPEENRSDHCDGQ
jgi:hypothetical protein